MRSGCCDYDCGGKDAFWNCRCDIFCMSCIDLNCGSNDRWHRYFYRRYLIADSDIVGSDTLLCTGEKGKGRQAKADSRGEKHDDTGILLDYTMYKGYDTDEEE